MKEKLFVRSEFIEQKQFIEWFKLTHRDKLINADVGGVWTKNYAQAMKNRLLGHSNGYPDIFIPEPNKKYHGLFIEMKRVKGGSCSPEQKGWIDALNKRGYKVIVCYGMDDAIKAVEEYF